MWVYVWSCVCTYRCACRHEVVCTCAVCRSVGVGMCTCVGVCACGRASAYRWVCTSTPAVVRLHFFPVQLCSFPPSLNFICLFLSGWELELDDCHLLTHGCHFKFDKEEVSAWLQGEGCGSGVSRQERTSVFFQGQITVCQP